MASARKWKPTRSRGAACPSHPELSRDFGVKDRPADTIRLRDDHPRPRPGITQEVAPNGEPKRTKGRRREKRSDEYDFRCPGKRSSLVPAMSAHGAPVRVRVPLQASSFLVEESSADGANHFW